MTRVAYDKFENAIKRLEARFRPPAYIVVRYMVSDSEKVALRDYLLTDGGWGALDHPNLALVPALNPTSALGKLKETAEAGFNQGLWSKHLPAGYRVDNYCCLFYEEELGR